MKGYESSGVVTTGLGSQMQLGALQYAPVSLGGHLQNVQVSGPIGEAIARIKERHVTGNKPLVVCNGDVREVKDLDEAQRVAEELAHKHSANAYILKPIRLVAPKRDVVTTDL